MQQNVSYTTQTGKLFPKLNKGATMYTQFEKAAQHYAELVERVKEVNEFWINSVLSATKEFFKTAKTK